MPAVSHAPRLRPPCSLNEQLVRLSHYCNVAVADASPQAILLASSVREHVITPIRHQLFNKELSNLLDEQLETVVILHSIFETFLGPDTTPPLSAIYKALDKAIKPLHPGHTQQTLTLIWHDLHKLLIPHITEWISRGLVHDSTNFFITPHPDLTFTIDHNNLPPFITSEAAQAILQTGLVRRTINSIAPKKQCPYIQVTLPRPCTTLSMVAASIHWRRDAVQHLSQVLPFDKLRDKLILIRDQLLQGDGLFWRSFFDQLRKYHLHLHAENDDDNAHVERALNAVLNALSDGNPPFVFVLRGGVIPSIPFSFVEQQLFQKRCHVYTKLFSITFNARRASENARHAFVHLNALHRELRSFENGLMETMTLRRRIECAILAVESYIHLDVLRPNFERVLQALNGKFSDRRGQSEEAVFDVVTTMHNNSLDDIATKCFLQERQIGTRLTAIFGVSLAFSDFIVDLTADHLREKSVTESVTSCSVEFNRNVVLLFQLLSALQKEKPEANLSSLLHVLEGVCQSNTSL